MPRKGRVKEESYVVALKSGKYEEFLQHFQRIERELANENRAREILEEARRNSPIVDGLLQAIPVVVVNEEGHRKLARLDDMRRDLLVILALRAVEKEHLLERLQLRFMFN